MPYLIKRLFFPLPYSIFQRQTDITFFPGCQKMCVMLKTDQIQIILYLFNIYIEVLTEIQFSTTPSDLELRITLLLKNKILNHRTLLYNISNTFICSALKHFCCVVSHRGYDLISAQNSIRKYIFDQVASLQCRKLEEGEQHF